MRQLPTLLLSCWLVATGAAQTPAEASQSPRATEQVPDDVVATFELDGSRQQISAVDLSLELARRDRLRARGQEALEHLVHRTLVSSAAVEEGVAPTNAEVEARIRELSNQLEGYGKTLQQFLAEKNISRESFASDYIGLSIAHEKLVMKSAGLRSRAEVTPDLLQLWLEEARSKAKVEIEPDKLSPGVVARIGDTTLSMADLGDVLRQNASASTRENAVRQIVIRRLLDAAAKREEIRVSQPEMDAEVERRRKLIEADSKYQGVPFEELLKSQGTSIDELRESPVIRAQVQRNRLIDLRFPDTVLEEHLKANRAEVLRRHGAKRHLNVILIRAAEEPNQFIQLDFEAGLEQAKMVKQRMADGMSFGVAARIHSEDPNSKVRGGDVGTHGFDSDALPREVLDTAYHLDPFVVSEPVRTDAGYYLVMVSKIEDPPTEKVLRSRLRREFGNTFITDMITAAKLELTDAR